MRTHCDICSLSIGETRRVDVWGLGELLPRRFMTAHVCKSCYMAEQTPELAERFPFSLLPLSVGRVR